MTHYVYKLADPITDEFYIGSRSCKCDISDDRYMGSYKTWKPENKSRLVKTILKSDFDNRDDATIYESNLIKEFIHNPLNRNYNVGGGIFCTVGLIGVVDSHGNNLRVPANDARYISGELKPFFKGKQHTMEAKIKIGEANKLRPPYWQNRTFSDEHKEKISNALKIVVKTEKQLIALLNNCNYWLGKTQSREHVDKMAKGHMKPILQYTKDNNFIKEWDSIILASKELNIHRGSISWNCKGKLKSAGGFIWKYKN